MRPWLPDSYTLSWDPASHMDQCCGGHMVSVPSLLSQDPLTLKVLYETQGSLQDPWTRNPTPGLCPMHFILLRPEVPGEDARTTSLSPQGSPARWVPTYCADCETQALSPAELWPDYSWPSTASTTSCGPSPLSPPSPSLTHTSSSETSAQHQEPGPTLVQEPGPVLLRLWLAESLSWGTGLSLGPKEGNTQPSPS
jgi:hypothetical protein